MSLKTSDSSQCQIHRQEVGQGGTKILELRWYERLSFQKKSSSGMFYLGVT
jgi:hypothetical protein